MRVLLFSTHPNTYCRVLEDLSILTESVLSWRARFTSLEFWGPTGSLSISASPCSDCMALSQRCSRQSQSVDGPPPAGTHPLRRNSVWITASRGFKMATSSCVPRKPLNPDRSLHPGPVCQLRGRRPPPQQRLNDVSALWGLSLQPLPGELLH